MGQRVAELENAQEVSDILGFDNSTKVLALFDDLARYFAAHISDFAFQIAHARFTGIRTDDVGDGVIGKFQVLVGQPRLQHLLLNQELLGDFYLFQLCVTMQP